VRWHSCHLELILGFIRRNSPTVGLLSGRIFRVQVVMEGEDKFEVDPDWLMPEVTRLVPHGGRLDRAVRKLDNTYSIPQVLA
jgi:hypothetical protein